MYITIGEMIADVESAQSKQDQIKQIQAYHKKYPEFRYFLKYAFFNDLEPAYTKIPDVIISSGSDGEFSVAIVSGNMPKIILSKEYYDNVKSKVSDKEGRKYLSEQYMRAANLIKAVERRKETILKTAIAIFEKQKSFFEYGIMELKPMTLSEVASMISMHESSISRITNGKYIETPFGIFEMKDFFTSKKS